MLVSTIVMIPAPIAHVSAEDLYSVEEPAEYVDPIILPVDDDGFDDDVIDTTYDDERQGDNPPVLDDTTYDDTTYDDTTYDDTIYTDSENTDEISDDISDGNESNAGSNVIDNIYYCELYGEETCLCDICEYCEEECTCDICEYCEEECTCDICEYCEEECTCDVIDLSMLRSDVLIATKVDRSNYLDSIITGNVNAAQAVDFVGDYDADTINAAIKAGTPVIGIISVGFFLHKEITIPSGHNIILTSEESQYDFPLGMIMNFRHFVIEPGATLTLHKAVLAAFVSQHPLTVGANAVRGGVLVNGGTLIMEDGAEIRFNHNRSADGGGGGLTIISGEAIMNGGEIKGNRSTSGNSNYRGGGGVYVGPNGKFTMTGGLIDNNLVAASTGSDANLTGGGGVYVEGEFNFTGGTIMRNRTNQVAGIQHGGGGVFVAPGGRFTMSNGVIANNTSDSVGGAILLRDNATLNLHGGAIYGNNAGNSKGITWFGGTINISGNPIVGYNNNDDYIDRFTTTNDPNQIINIVGPLGNNARINIREHTGDRARSEDVETGLTVIARMNTELGNANNHEAQRFHYLGTGDPRSTWYVIPRNPGNDPDLILYQPPVSTKFALLRVPDNIHFGERSLLTTTLVGPYGDAPRASNVVSDYLEGAEKWSYGFEIENTEHDNWTLTLQTVPFRNSAGVIGANPVAIRKNVNNPAPIDLNSTPLRVITITDIKGDSIKWHWTQLDYRIEAQTALNTVIADNFQSVFTWTLQDVPT